MEQRKRERRQPKRDSLLPVKFFIVLGVILAIIILIAEGCEAKQPVQNPDPTDPNPTETLEPTEQVRKVEILRMTNAEMAVGELVLVNADYGFESEVSTTPLYAEAADCYYVADWQIALRPEIIQPLNDWLTDLYEDTGINDTLVVAGHRTVDYQQKLYDNAVATKGQAHADAYIALPGHSEHHTGLALDFDSYTDQGVLGGFDGEADYQRKVIETAGKYGFIQRYPEGKDDITGINFEAWHFRYVGLPHSALMQEKNLCLEEYIDLLKGYPYEGEHLKTQVDGVSYEIWYCEGLQVTVPSEERYSVSGNNADGFIVTVRMD